MNKYIDAEELIERLEEMKRAEYENCGGVNSKTGVLQEVQELIDSLQQEQPNNMIRWTGYNLKEVIDFTGKSPRFGEWFKSWEEYENYVHTHNDILKLFCEDGSHYEVPVGSWIVKTPDGYNVPSVARFIHAKQEQPKGLRFPSLNRLIMKIPSENWNDTVNNYAKKLRDCLIKEGYRKDAEVLQGYISYMNGNNVPMATMDEQEQPESGSSEKPNNPAEWSKEDEFFRQQLIVYCENCVQDSLAAKCIAWLKSLHSRPKASDNWKPSEEQMKIFNEAVEHYSKHWDNEDIKILCSLYDDLKKL